MNAASQPARDPRKFPFPPVIPIIALLLSWGLGRLWHMDVSWPAWSQLVGWARSSWTAVALVLSAVLAFRRHHTVVDPLGKVSTIVMSGPFRHTRNPMYLSLMLFDVGGTLVFRLPWATILFIPVFLALHFGVILPEEQHLESSFGEPYRLYRQLTQETRIASFFIDPMLVFFNKCSWPWRWCAPLRHSWPLGWWERARVLCLLSMRVLFKDHVALVVNLAEVSIFPAA